MTEFPITIPKERVIEDYDKDGALTHYQIDATTYYHKSPDGKEYKIWEDKEHMSQWKRDHGI